MKITTKWIYEGSPLEVTTYRSSSESYEEWLARHFTYLGLIWHVMYPDASSEIRTDWGPTMDAVICPEESGFIVEHESKCQAEMELHPPEEE